MKTRNGFVSNSSSSSYIVILPDNFKVNSNDDIIVALAEVLKSREWLGFNCDDMPDIKGASQSDIAESVWLLKDLLRPYVVQRIDGGPDCSGGISVISNDKIRKIWGQ